MSFSHDTGAHRLTRHNSMSSTASDMTASMTSVSPAMAAIQAQTLSIASLPIPPIPMRMSSLDHLNTGVPPEMRRRVTPSSSQQATAATSAATAGRSSPAAAAVSHHLDPPSLQRSETGLSIDALNASGEVEETFNELEIVYAARASAALAAQLAAQRQSDWSINRTSELPASMLSEARVLGTPGGTTGPKDRYTRASRWVLSPASQLHHLPPDSKRAAVHALRDLVRQRKRESDLAEAKRFEDRLREKARRKLAKEDAARRAEVEAQEEYRRGERFKRKQRKDNKARQSSSANDRSRNNAPGGIAGIFGLQIDLTPSHPVSPVTATVTLSARARAAQTAAAAAPPMVSATAVSVLDDPIPPHVDHSGLSFPVEEAVLAPPCSRCEEATATGAAAAGTNSERASSPSCLCPAQYLTLSPSALDVPLHPHALTSIALSLQARNTSASLLAVRVGVADDSGDHSSPASQHVFIQSPPPSTLATAFIFAGAEMDLLVDYVGDFRMQCADLLAASNSNSGEQQASSPSPHVLTVSIRALSRSDVASGFAHLPPTVFWTHADKAAETDDAQATHVIRVPMRWVAGDGSHQSNIPGADEQRYTQLLAEQSATTTADEAVLAAAAAASAPASGPAALVRFLTPSMDPERTPLFPGSFAPSPQLSPGTSDAASTSKSSVPTANYFPLDQMIPIPTSLAHHQQQQQQQQQQLPVPDDMQALVMAMRAQMHEQQQQIAEIKASQQQQMQSTQAAVNALPVELPADDAATSAKKRTRSARARTLLSLSSMRAHVESAQPSSQSSVHLSLPVVSLPSAEDEAARDLRAQEPSTDATERRKSRRRTRGVKPIMAEEAAPAQDLTAPPSDDAAAARVKPPLTLQVPVSPTADASAADVVAVEIDDPIKAERMARRRTLSHVEARRRIVADEVEEQTEGEEAKAAAAAAAEVSSTEHVLRKAEEEIQRSKATAPPVYPSSPPPPPAAAVEVRQESAAVQTALTWLDEAHQLPLVAATGQAIPVDALIAAVASRMPPEEASAEQATYLDSDSRAHSARSHHGDAAHPDHLTAAAYPVAEPDLAVDGVDTDEADAHGAEQQADSDAEDDDVAAEEEAEEDNDPRSLFSLLQLMADWDEQLRLAEHRRAEQAERFAALKSVASTTHATAAMTTPDKLRHPPRIGSGRAALRSIDDQLMRSERNYLHAEMHSLAEERATLMALELDVAEEAARRGVDLDPLTMLQEHAEDKAGTTGGRSPKRTTFLVPDDAPLHVRHAALCERMLRLEALRAQHRSKLLGELTRLRGTSSPLSSSWPSRNGAATGARPSLESNIGDADGMLTSPQRYHLSPDPIPFFTQHQRTSPQHGQQPTQTRSPPAIQQRGMSFSFLTSVEKRAPRPQSSGAKLLRAAGVPSLPGQPAKHLTDMPQLHALYGHKSAVTAGPRRTPYAAQAVAPLRSLSPTKRAGSVAQVGVQSRPVVAASLLPYASPTASLRPSASQPTLRSQPNGASPHHASSGVGAGSNPYQRTKHA